MARLSKSPVVALLLLVRCRIAAAAPCSGNEICVQYHSQISGGGPAAACASGSCSGYCGFMWGGCCSNCGCGCTYATPRPTPSPTRYPTTPTTAPTHQSKSPTASPTMPTPSPTAAPSKAPTASPTSAPSSASPTAAPSSPTPQPTRLPSTFPTLGPTPPPSFSPTPWPTGTPTLTGTCTGTEVCARSSSWSSIGGCTDAFCACSSGQCQGYCDFMYGGKNCGCGCIARPDPIRTTANIAGAVNFYKNNVASGIRRYGPMSEWDTSAVTDMSNLFSLWPGFNEDIEKWAVQRVTNFQGMFMGAQYFNGALSSWDVSGAYNFFGMFQGASKFDGDIVGWDVIRATNMERMFSGADMFDRDLSSWAPKTTGRDELPMPVTAFLGMFVPAAAYEARCERCPVGRHLVQRCLGLQEAVCLACRPGRFVTTRVSTRNCKACPPGFHQPVEGQSLCTACPASPETYCPEAATSLVPVRDGYFTSPEASVAKTRETSCANGREVCFQGVRRNCTTCAAGKYQVVRCTTVSDPVCQDCAYGTFKVGTNVAGSCDTCPAGFAANARGSVACDPCSSPATFCPAGSAVPIAVTSGSVSLPEQQGAERTGQEQCERGKHFAVGGLRRSCTTCEPGRYAVVPCTRTADSFCQDCGVGRYTSSANEGVCTTCPSGFGQNADQSACEPCSACSAGKRTVKHCSETATGAPECVVCQKGTFTTAVESRSKAPCMVCPAGFHQDGLGQSSCVACRAVATFCPAGSAQPVTTSSGFYTLPEDTAANKLREEQCRIGVEYCTGGARLACEPCLPGESMRSDCTLTANNVCDVCPPGRYSDANNADSCAACPRGYAASAGGATACDACALGRASALTATATCATCVAGRFAPTGGASDCALCPLGFSSYAVAAADEDGVSSSSGDGGGAGNSSSSNTAAASLSRASCVACSRGHFAAMRGQARCEACLARSQYQPKEGADKCEKCPDELAAEGGGSALCTTATLVPRSGFWRPNASVLMEDTSRDLGLIQRCVVRTPELCLGVEPGNESIVSNYKNVTAQLGVARCIAHHHGPMCMLCDDDYVRGAGTCFACAAPGTSVAWSTSLALLAAIFVVLVLFLRAKVGGNVRVRHLAAVRDLFLDRVGASGTANENARVGAGAALTARVQKQFDRAALDAGMSHGDFTPPFRLGLPLKEHFKACEARLGASAPSPREWEQAYVEEQVKPALGIATALLTSEVKHAMEDADVADDLRKVHDELREGFANIYTAVSDMVDSEPGYGQLLADAEALVRTGEARSGGKGKKVRQSVDGAVALYRQAAEAKPFYDAFLTSIKAVLDGNDDSIGKDLVDRVTRAAGRSMNNGSGGHHGTSSLVLKLAPLKSMYRASEKAVFKGKGSFNCVCDVVRGLFDCHDVAILSRCLRALKAADGHEIQILRVKNRFAHPTSGGWRDLLINFRLRDDPGQHICEVQISHQRLMLVRSEMGGHGDYNIFRAALELLVATGNDPAEHGNIAHSVSTARNVGRAATAAASGRAIAADGNLLGRINLLFTHFQTSGLMSVAWPAIRWPASVRALGSFMRAAVLDVRMLFAACPMFLFPSGILLANLLFVPIAILVVAIAAMLHRVFGRKKQRPVVQERASILIYFACFLSYPSVCQRAFQALSCTPVVSGVDAGAQATVYVTQDFNVQCGTSEHLRQFMLPAVLLILANVIGIPLVYFCLLYRQRRFLHPGQYERTAANDARHERVKRLYGAIYRLYETKYWYFEIVEMLRKVALVGVPLAIQNDAVKDVVGLAVGLAYLLLVARTQPCVEDSDDRVQSVAAFQIFLTACYAAVMRASPTGTNDASVIWILALVGTTMAVIVLSVVSIGGKLGLRQWWRRHACNPANKAKRQGRGFKNAARVVPVTESPSDSNVNHAGPSSRSPKRVVTAFSPVHGEAKDGGSADGGAATATTPTVVRVINKTAAATLGGEDTSSSSSSAQEEQMKAKTSFERFATSHGADGAAAVAESRLPGLFKELGFKDKHGDAFARLSRKYCTRYDANGNGLLEWQEFEKLHEYLCERRGRRKD